MIRRILALSLVLSTILTFPLWPINGSTIEDSLILSQQETDLAESLAVGTKAESLAEETKADTRAPKNKDFNNVRVYNTLGAQHVWVQEEAHVGGALSVLGDLTAENATLNDDLTVAGILTAQDATINGDLTVTGTLQTTGGLTTDDITLNTITKNGVTTAWPTTSGAANTFLANDGAGNLVYAIPAGGGNVSTAAFFTTNNRLVTTDTPSSVTNIKQTPVTLDSSNNISGVNTLSATILSGSLNGTTPLIKTTTEVADATQVVHNATNTLTPNTLVLRDASNNFSAGTITANLIIGDVSGSAGTAGFATNAGTAVNFSGSVGTVGGDVTGTQGNLTVNKVGGSTAGAINTTTQTVSQATDSNTGGALVKRDGFGNFSARKISADLVGSVTGNFTGPLYGNATTATNATTAGSATNFTGLLAGNVTGNQSSTVVATVGGKTAASIAAATSMVESATNIDIHGTLVLRDSNGNFATHMITLNTSPVSPSDATTKAYVDDAVSVAATGIQPKAPARVVETLMNLALTGTGFAIDDVIINTDDRILLINQTNPKENGLWLAQPAPTPWNRPLDFNVNTTAETAYVLTTSGSINAGASWLCNTPLAYIGTDPISFVQFGMPSQTTGLNVGTGAGEVYKDKDGTILNFRTLAAGSHTTVLTAANEVTIGTDATTATAGTIVTRDGSGNFTAGTISAALNGAASLNVLKAGDIMSGTLSMTTGNEIRWHDTTAGNYIGFKAPTSITNTPGYTISLPNTAPVAGQYLHATSPNATDWQNIDAPPSANKTFYVSLAGSDDPTNDGSLSLPYRTVKKALIEANKISSSTNPIVIEVGSGIFTEDNTSSLRISADNISIIGSSILSTIIQPSSSIDDLFTMTATNVELYNLELRGPSGSNASAIRLTADSPGKYCFKNLLIDQFKTGFSLNSTTANPTIFLDNARLFQNETGISVTDALVVINNSYFKGSSTDTPGNSGMIITGANASVNVFDSVISTCTTGIAVTSGALSVVASEFEHNENSVVCTGGSHCDLTGNNFSNNTLTTINIAASEANTTIISEGCNFHCSESPLDPRGTVFKATNGGEIVATAHIVNNAALGIQCGATEDTNTSIIKAGSVYLVGCAQDIEQKDAAILRFLGGVFDKTKVLIDNPTNVTLASYDRPELYGTITMAIGSLKDVSQKTYEILQGSVNSPYLGYEPNYYGSQGTVYKNPLGTKTFTGVQALGNDACEYVITSSRDKQTCLKLVSDTSDWDPAAPNHIGGGNNVRGWTITKLGNSADLAFSYTNNDSSGLAISGPNTIMQLDGNNNRVLFPTATNTPVDTTAQLLWGSDTNLYRSAANTLKTDDSFIVTGVLTSGAFSAGNTMLTTLTLDAGTASSPSLQFVGSSNTGLSAATTNKLSFDISGSEKLAINATTVTATTTLVSAAALVLSNVMCLQSTQTAHVSGATNPITVKPTTNMLLISYGGASTAQITMPTTPLDGQLLTIMAQRTGAGALSLEYVPTSSFDTYEISALNPGTWAARTGGQSVTYIYNVTNSKWYRYARG